MGTTNCPVVGLCSRIPGCVLRGPSARSVPLDGEFNSVLNLFDAGRTPPRTQQAASARADLDRTLTDIANLEKSSAYKCVRRAAQALGDELGLNILGRSKTMSGDPIQGSSSVGLWGAAARSIWAQTRAARYLNVRRFSWLAPETNINLRLLGPFKIRCSAKPPTTLFLGITLHPWKRATRLLIVLRPSVSALRPPPSFLQFARRSDRTTRSVCIAIALVSAWSAMYSRRLTCLLV